MSQVLHPSHPSKPLAGLPGAEEAGTECNHAIVFGGNRVIAGPRKAGINMLNVIKVIALSVVFIIIALAAWSCGPDLSEEQQDRLAARTAAPARHAIRTDQLHKIMEDLGRSSAQDWPQEMANLRSEQDEQARFREARRVADALAQAAKQIPASIADAPLTEQQREAFLASVEELEQKAAQLEAAAAAHDLKRMRSTLSTIKTNCYGCHAQFSEYAGPLQFGRSGR